MRFIANLCIYSLLAFVFLPNTSKAQSFKIDRFERIGDDLIIYYNLADSINNRVYTINLYASNDNFINPLTKVEGDLGIEIKPGGNRKIIWHAKEELGSSFKGSVAIEVRGKLYVPFVKLDAFEDYKKFKRKKNYKIVWTGGRGDQVLNFDLYRGNKKITTYPNIANVGNFNLRFDGVRPGRNYSLKITDIKNKDDVVITEPFKIKRKTPLLLKVLPVLGLGFALIQLAPIIEQDIVDPITPK
jgi:hypothetical protein